MTYFDVLALPLVVFWAFNRQVDRLRAETEQRLLRLHMAAASAEGAKTLGEALEREIGTTLLYEATFDRRQFEALRAKYSNKAMTPNTHADIEKE